MERIEFNGMNATRALELLADQPAVEWPDGHVFIRIPIERQRLSLDGACGSFCCDSQRTGRLAFWDTVGYHPSQCEVWTVHYPDLLDRPGYPKRVD